MRLIRWLLLLPTGLGFGVQKGDLVTELNGQAVNDTGEIGRTLSGLKKGDTTTLTLLRAGRLMQLQVRF
jgi:S1-C subfamily serine protease